MLDLTYSQRHSSNAVAGARVNGHPAFTMDFSWTTTKPYGDQRPPGAPPG